ncbi:MAG: hypothetical protein DRJ97_06215 [Thermoprotei archaeon]|nr:MAG: hypothetical protein DRJ97_06215 [Thermoprotei archaeon]
MPKGVKLEPEVSAEEVVRALRLLWAEPRVKLQVTYYVVRVSYRKGEGLVVIDLVNGKVCREIASTLSSLGLLSP